MILIALSLVLRKILNSNDSDNILTKKLINYLSNEKCSKENSAKDNDYNTFDLEKANYIYNNNNNKSNRRNVQKRKNNSNSNNDDADNRGNQIIHIGNETEDNSNNNHLNDNQGYSFINSQNINMISIPNLIKNQVDCENNNARNFNEKSSFFGNNSKDTETQLKEAKLSRFAIDYCRASPSITLKSPSLLNIGWRQTKYYFSVDFESIDYNGDVRKETGIMNIYPAHKSLVNFDYEMLKENFCNLILSLNNHENLVPCYHLDVLKNHNLLVKIEKFYPAGSLRDLIYGTNALENFNKKYPQNKKGKGLHPSLISFYGKQILSTLAYLHEKKIYHLHLHSGNILIDEKNNKIKISGIENFICDFTIRNEIHFNFLLENISQNEFTHNKTNNSDLFVDIFRNKFNFFEKFDLISFGRILYEMVFGKELNCQYPDEIELKSIDEEIAKVFWLIFNRKESRNGYSNKISFPEVSAKDLLKKAKLFNINYMKEEEKIKEKGNKKSSQVEEGGKLLDENKDNEGANGLLIENEEICANLKQRIYDQNRFLKKKIKEISRIIY